MTQWLVEEAAFLAVELADTRAAADAAQEMQAQAEAEASRARLRATAERQIRVAR